MIKQLELELLEDNYTGSDHWRTFNCWNSDDQLIATLYLRKGVGDPKDITLMEDTEND